MIYIHRLFDEKAQKYDKWYESAAGRIIDSIEKEAIFSYLEIRPGLTLLDIGCGTGNYSIELAEKGVMVIGIDISNAMLEKARSKIKERDLPVEFRQADAVNLPFESNCFDAVISVTALEFVLSISNALDEAYRVLKPGGRLVVGVIGREGEWGRYYTEKARQNKDSVFYRARLYTLEELKNAMPGKLLGGRAALFIPPDFDFTKEKEALELEASEARSGRTDGGFVCAASAKTY